MMKKIVEQIDISFSPNVTIDKRLEKYDSMPLFQKKADKVKAILAEYPFTDFINEQINNRIKLCFEKGFSIAKTASQLKLSKEEVILRLKEMGLIEQIEA